MGRFGPYRNFQIRQNLTKTNNYYSAHFAPPPTEVANFFGQKWAVFIRPKIFNRGVTGVDKTLCLFLSYGPNYTTFLCSVQIRMFLGVFTYYNIGF